MKLYIWKENIKNGAYHEDGSAVVLAESAEQALHLLEQRDREEGDKGHYVSYHWGKAELSDVTELAVPTSPTIVLITIGCDC